MATLMCPDVQRSTVLVNCGAAAVVTTLNYKQVPRPHLMLGDDNGCFYMRAKQTGYVVASYRYTVAEQLLQYGIQQHEYQSESAEDLWTAIQSNLEAANPVMVYCDTAHLPFMPSYSTPHLTVVRGCDTHTRQVHLCDATGGYVSFPWVDFVRAAQLDPAMARLLHSERPFKWETIDAARAVTLAPEHLLTKLRENLALLRSEAQLGEAGRCQLLNLWQMPSDSKVVSGWQALDAYADDVPELLGGAETAIVYRTHWIVWDTWQQRRVLQETLRYLADALHRTDLAQAAGRLDEAIKSWTLVRGLVMKHELRPTPNNLEALSRRLRQLRIEEERALSELAL